MDNIEFRGQWWLPDTPEDTVAGVLSFSQKKGGKLELIGSFDSVFDKGHGEHPIILGTTVDGKLVTLQKCWETKRVAPFPGFESTDYLVHFIFVGDHIPTEEAIRFNKLQAKFTYLYDWVHITGVSREVLDGGQKVQFTYTIPDDISIAMPEAKLDITFGANFKSNYDLSHITEGASIYIEFDQDKDFYELSKGYLFPLGALVSLGTTKAGYVEELFLFRGDVPTPDKFLTAYYSQQFYQPKVKAQLHRPDMLFTLADIYENLETKINNWLSASAKLDSVLHLLRRTRISPELFLELRFLSLAQAIETYHRFTRNNHVVSTDEHEARVWNILIGLSEPDEEWLRQILTHANEPRLAQRLNELLIENKDVINPQINNPQDSNTRRSKFVRRITGTRNYYTHFDKAREAEASKGAELYYLTEKLTILLEACLLGELGVSPDQQPELFRQNDRYNRLTSY